MCAFKVEILDFEMRLLQMFKILNYKIVFCQLNPIKITYFIFIYDYIISKIFQEQGDLVILIYLSTHKKSKYMTQEIQRLEIEMLQISLFSKNTY